MSQYDNPDLTQREIVEQSVEAIQATIESVDLAVTETNARRAVTLDYLSAQVLAQHASMLNGTKFQLSAELTRLNNVIAVWNGEDVSPTTPMMPTTPISAS